ncbi:hypothetical protein V494_03936 [Pseudogymnoascus sp. VKM F-4513 (FW-928)]|nr:hypothetical protein V494_03936 [Pseudogymnoascus sp. VKM F-4513 (FW-928)]
MPRSARGRRLGTRSNPYPPVSNPAPNAGDMSIDNPPAPNPAFNSAAQGFPNPNIANPSFNGAAQGNIANPLFNGAAYQGFPNPNIANPSFNGAAYQGPPNPNIASPLFNGVAQGIPNQPEFDPNHYAIWQMRDTMAQLHGAAQGMCGQYLTARDALRSLRTRDESLWMLNGKSLDWDNLDVEELTQMILCLVETSRKLGDAIEGVRLSMARLVRVCVEGFGIYKSVQMWYAMTMCARVSPLMEQLAEAHEVLEPLVERIGMEPVEGIMIRWQSGEERERTQRTLSLVMQLWTWQSDFVDELVVFREAVVSIREVVTYERQLRRFGIVEPPAEDVEAFEVAVGVAVEPAAEDVEVAMGVDLEVEG